MTVFTQGHFVADFLEAKCDCFTKIGRFAFSKPPLGDLGVTYDDHLRLIGKRVVDFLLVLVELFCWVFRLRRHERILVENRQFRSSGGRLTQNFT